jgi:hypothetical protein
MPLSKNFVEKLHDYIDSIKKLSLDEKRNMTTIVIKIINKINNMLNDIIEDDIRSNSPTYNKPHSTGNIVDVILQKISTQDLSYIIALIGKRQFETIYKPFIELYLDMHYSQLGYYYTSSTIDPSIPLSEFIERGILMGIMFAIMELQTMSKKNLNRTLVNANQAKLLRNKTTRETTSSRNNTRRRSNAGAGIDPPSLQLNKNKNRISITRNVAPVNTPEQIQARKKANAALLNAQVAAWIRNNDTRRQRRKAQVIENLRIQKATRNNTNNEFRRAHEEPTLNVRLANINQPEL